MVTTGISGPGDRKYIVQGYFAAAQWPVESNITPFMIANRDIYNRVPSRNILLE